MSRLRRSPVSPVEFRRALVSSLLLLSLLGCHRSGKAKVVEPVDQVYQQAMRKLEKKRYYAARTLLQSLLTRIPQDERGLLPLVQLHLADAFYRDGGVLNLGEALAAYRNFLTYYPQREEAAYVQYQIGMCHYGQVLAPDRDQELTFTAIEEFEKVEKLYPGSPQGEKARQRILDCRERLAAHEMTIGRFYLKRKDHLAAADRFRTILDKYPHYKRTEEVLYLLAKSLVATSNPDEARLYVDRLVHDYPEGKFVKQARRLLESPEKG